MGTTQPDQVTEPVFWTQFPASAISDIDWADHQESHRAVMRLFARHLEGAQDERRKDAYILHRIDNVAGEPTVLVQSQVLPELVPPMARTVTLSDRAWNAAAGERVAFRVAINPVRRTTRFYTDTGRTQPADTSPRLTDGSRDRTNSRQTAAVIPVAELEAWLAAKLDGALDGIEIMNHYRDETRTGPHKLVIDTFDGFAHVSDPTRLSQLRLEGVGRAKAYGCGLLTIARLG